MGDKTANRWLDDRHYAVAAAVQQGYEWAVLRLPPVTSIRAGNAAPILSSDKPEPTADAALNAAEAAFRDSQVLK